MVGEGMTVPVNPSYVLVGEGEVVVGQEIVDVVPIEEEDEEDPEDEVDEREGVEEVGEEEDEDEEEDQENPEEEDQENPEEEDQENPEDEGDREETLQEAASDPSEPTLGMQFEDTVAESSEGYRVLTDDSDVKPLLIPNNKIIYFKELLNLHQYFDFFSLHLHFILNYTVK